MPKNLKIQRVYIDTSVIGGCRMEPNKSFDAVRMVWKIRDAHQEHLKSMSVEERLEFYREKSRVLRVDLLHEREQRAS